MSCGSITWSVVGTPSCPPNLAVDPQLGPDYRLEAGSPALEFGPSPATFIGSPCLDLDATARLKDHDGDGLARMDPGAFERLNSTLTPGDVPNLRWTSRTLLTWDAASGSVAQYHVYRDLRSNLNFGSFGVCRDDLDGDRTDLVLSDPEIPAPAQCFTYLIAADATAATPDGEGTLGLCRCMERSSLASCP